MDQQVDHNQSKSLFGFWIYLMTDLVLFGSLFATFMVLRNNTFGGPTGSELFSMPFVLTETIILLTSSFTCGLAVIALHRQSKAQLIGWLVVTFGLGLAFLGMELSEFSKLAHEGYGWQSNAFMSSFFTLVGTHGGHITAGLIWLAVIIVRVARGGLLATNKTGILMMSLFWHFLDIVWIFIFTIVYLLGEL